jgi:hypothetical protein
MPMSSDPTGCRSSPAGTGGWQPVADPAWTDTPDWDAIDRHAKQLGRQYWPVTAGRRPRATQTSTASALAAAEPGTKRVGGERAFTSTSPGRSWRLVRYVAAVLKQSKLAMVTTRSGRDTCSVAPAPAG